MAVEVSSDGINGLGDTHAYGCVCVLITGKPAKAIGGVDILVPPAAWRRMAWRSIRGARSAKPMWIAALRQRMVPFMICGTCMW